MHAPRKKYLDDNRPLKALEYFRIARSYAPDDPDINIAISEILTEIGYFEESNRLLMKVLREQREEISECYFGIGM